ncbi:MAG: hypothetical protein MJ082_06280 [Clostridia bacterium]|nr:hypothetical protein [Clostridia bacterium]
MKSNEGKSTPDKVTQRKKPRLKVSLTMREGRPFRSRVPKFSKHRRPPR